MAKRKRPQKHDGNTGTAYDDAFRTMLVRCLHLVIPVINEAFGKHYPKDAVITPRPNEHFLVSQKGEEAKKITDSAFSIRIEQDAPGDKYIFEAQSTADNRLLIRIVEYVFLDALESGIVEGNRVRVTVARAVVLYLRSTANTPDVMTVEIETPGGTVGFDVPVIKMANYTLEQIFEKKLFFLLPFFIFTREKELEDCEREDEKLIALTEEFGNLRNRLDAAVEAAELNSYDRVVIVEMLKRVLDKIAEKYAKVRKGVGNVMGGKVLPVSGSKFFDEGKTQGRLEGRTEGLLEGKQKTAFNLRKMGMSDDFIAQAVEEHVNIVHQWFAAPSVI